MRIAPLRLSLDQNEIERGIMGSGGNVRRPHRPDRGDTKVAEAAPT
jgi:hypothetical protein